MRLPYEWLVLDPLIRPWLTGQPSMVHETIFKDTPGKLGSHLVSYSKNIDEAPVFPSLQATLFVRILYTLRRT